MVAGTPASGTATVNLDGTITYTPTAGFIGIDIFTYSVEGKVATVTVTINPVMYLPIILKV
jgi:hypothetical protein